MYEKFLKEGQLKPRGLRGRRLRDNDVSINDQKKGEKGGHRVQENSKKGGKLQGDGKKGSGPLSEAHAKILFRLA